VIHRDVEIIDLDPRTWRQIGQIAPFDDLAQVKPLRGRVLSILHDQGRVLKIDAPADLILTLDERIDDPQAAARALYEELPDLDRVQIFDKASLTAYSDKVQRLDWKALTIDEFYFRAWLLAGDDPSGLCYYPSREPRWHRFEYPAVRDYMAGLADGSVLVLAVFEEGALWFNLIVRVESGQIRLITTFDTLAEAGEIKPGDADRLRPLIEQQIGHVAEMIFCSRQEFEAMLD
jgi:hypothetical protein